MRKFILIILFAISSIVSNSQTEFNFNSTNYGQFLLSSDAKCGVGNIYAIVMRSPAPNAYGYYCYQIYFASNSYFYDCNFARSYVPNIEVMYLEGKIWYYPQGFMTYWATIGQTTLVYTLYHPYSNLLLKIKTGRVEPTIY